MAVCSTLAAGGDCQWCARLVDRAHAAFAEHAGDAIALAQQVAFGQLGRCATAQPMAAKSSIRAPRALLDLPPKLVELADLLIWAAGASTCARRSFCVRSRSASLARTSSRIASSAPASGKSELCSATSIFLSDRPGHRRRLARRALFFQAAGGHQALDLKLQGSAGSAAM